MEINKRIKQLRIEKKLSQKQFASLLGVTQSGVSYMEQTGNNVSDSIIKSICAIFNVSEEWLLSGSDKMFAQSECSISSPGICDRIKELRTEHLKLTQTEFGSRIGVKQSSIAGYETGVRIPLDSIILSICREFNVCKDWLETGVGEIFVQSEHSISFPDVCKRMRELRKTYLKLSAEVFGKHLGVNRDVISNIENNRLAHPEQKFPLYKLICLEFGINEKWLLYGTDPVFSNASAGSTSSKPSFDFSESGNDFFLDVISEALKIYNNFDSKEQEAICIFMKTLIEHFAK